MALMNKAVEDRARAQCALDAEVAGVRRKDIIATVERFWPVVAAEMMGVRDDESLIQPPDMAERQAEYRKIRP